ncbi:hypothetical protein [Cohnella rhizosphaerae]|uniref:Uncharacterized protein n=1 Tax=Cohnella rhizosphaerae TaxID=1457232 RepID=A0A9X4KRH5_9BACL|nr:hypothetical protein [Cohnella rhizosphaerae]MDG0809213.1 hypothetical protein [Cohnella rhizosphaerae]
MHLQKREITELKKEIKKIMNIESENRLWISVTLGSPEKSTIDFEFLSDYSNQIDLVIDHGISPRNIRRKNDNVEYKDYIQELLDCYIGRNVVIPYDLEERRKKYPKAFNELESYMHKYL